MTDKWKAFSYWAIGSIILWGLVGIGISLYGNSQLNEGKRQCVAEYNAAADLKDKEYRAKEVKAKKESDEKFAKAEAEKAKDDAARNDLAHLYDSLQRDTEIYKRRLSSANTNTAGLIKTANAALDNYQQCKKEYSSLGIESSEVAGRLIGLQHQVQ